MSATENRKVSILINGEEVAASVKLIRNEIRKATSDLNNAEIGSKKYNDAMARIGELQPLLKKHTQEVKAMGGATEDLGKKSNEVRGIWDKMKASVGKGGILGSLIGVGGPIALVGAAFGVIKSGLGTMQEFETQIANLSARTGLAGRDLETLKGQAIQLGAAYGQAPKAIVEAFAEAASARPELMKNSEALAQFTEQALILSTITKTDVNTSIQDLTTIMNTNSLATSETASVVNQLVGASQLGAKEIPFLSQAMEKIGGTAKNANVSLAEQSAVLEVLGEKYTSSAETAGTNVRNILITLQKEWEASNEGPFNFKQALDQLAPSVNNVTELTNLFGKENVVAAQTLLQNRDRIDELTTGIEKFTDATKVAEIQQNTFEGAQKRLSASWDGLWASAESGNGVLTKITNALSNYLSTVQNVASGLSLAYRKIFDSEGLAAEKAAETAQAAKNSRVQLANDLVSRATVDSTGKISKDDRVYTTLNALKQAQQGLNQESDKWKTNQEKIDAITVAINDREQRLLKQKIDAEERRKQAAEEARKKAEEERKVQVKITEELIKQKQLASKEGNVTEGIQPIKAKGADPLKDFADLEAQKTETFKKASADRADVDKAIQDKVSEYDVEAHYAAIQRKADLTGLGVNTVNQIWSAGIQNRTRNEMAQLEESKRRGLISENEYNKRKEALERQAFEKKKKLDIATALANGALAVTKILAQTGVLAPGAILAALAETASQVAIIAATKYEKGGYVNGPRHSQGGVPAELEGGEYVINRNAVNEATLPLLAAINNGVAPLMNWGRSARNMMFANGGFVNAQNDQSNQMMLTIAGELRTLRAEMSHYEMTKRVVLVKEDQVKFDERNTRIQNIAQR